MAVGTEISIVCERSAIAWKLFFQRCSRTLLEFEEFKIVLRNQSIRYPLAAEDIFRTWAQSQYSTRIKVSRQHRYFDILFTSLVLDDLSVLRGLRRELLYVFDHEREDVEATQRDLERSVLGAAIQSLAEQGAPEGRKNQVHSRDSSTVICKELTKLILLCTNAVNGQTILNNSPPDIVYGLAAYTYRYISDLVPGKAPSPALKGAPKRKSDNSFHKAYVLTKAEVRRWLSYALPPLIATLSSWNVDAANSLSDQQRQLNLYDSKDRQSTDLTVENMSAAGFDASIGNEPIVIARASLYIYLNAMVILMHKTRLAATD